MKKKYWLIILAVLAFCIAWNIYWNQTIVVRTYVHSNKDVPEPFDGYRIVQLTDIHSVRSIKQGKLIYAKTAAQKPDVICITGDLVDSRYYAEHGIEGEKLTLLLLEELVQLAPVYFVYGNHEMILLDDPQRNAFKIALEEMGVHLINNEKVYILAAEDDNYEEGQKGHAGIQEVDTHNSNGEETAHIILAGIQDPSTLYKDYQFAYLSNNGERMEAMLDTVTEGIGNEDFTLLLSHRPEYLEMYDQYPVDLCLTGHAHGGQFRLPFIGGIYAPGQGFLPKYTFGLYETEDLEMYVGTGIGNSLIPVRVFNPPEIITVVLECGE